MKNDEKLFCVLDAGARMRITIKVAKMTIKENLSEFEHENGKFRRF